MTDLLPCSKGPLLDRTRRQDHSSSVCSHRAHLPIMQGRRPLCLCRLASAISTWLRSRISRRANTSAAPGSFKSSCKLDTWSWSAGSTALQAHVSATCRNCARARMLANCFITGSCTGPLSETPERSRSFLITDEQILHLRSVILHRPKRSSICLFGRFYCAVARPGNAISPELRYRA